MPGFKLGGRYLVDFGATKERCSFYTGRAPIEAHAAALTGCRLGKGTINYLPDLPLPAELVSRLVNVRVAERPASGALARDR